MYPWPVEEKMPFLWEAIFMFFSKFKTASGKRFHTYYSTSAMRANMPFGAYFTPVPIPEQSTLLMRSV